MGMGLGGASPVPKNVNGLGLTGGASASGSFTGGNAPHHTGSFFNNAYNDSYLNHSAEKTIYHQ
jgi:hypothetical protein